MRVFSRIILAVLIVATLSSPVSADYLYTFTGPLFDQLGTHSFTITGVYTPTDHVLHAQDYVPPSQRGPGDWQPGPTDRISGSFLVAGSFIPTSSGQPQMDWRAGILSYS